MHYEAVGMALMVGWYSTMKKFVVFGRQLGMSGTQRSVNHEIFITTRTTCRYFALHISVIWAREKMPIGSRGFQPVVGLPGLEGGNVNKVPV